jgi:hypothetical protein
MAQKISVLGIDIPKLVFHVGSKISRPCIGCGGGSSKLGPPW